MYGSLIGWKHEPHTVGVIVASSFVVLHVDNVVAVIDMPGNLTVSTEMFGSIGTAKYKNIMLDKCCERLAVLWVWHGWWANLFYLYGIVSIHRRQFELNENQNPPYWIKRGIANFERVTGITIDWHPSHFDLNMHWLHSVIQSTICLLLVSLCKILANCVFVYTQKSFSCHY